MFGSLLSVGKVSKLSYSDTKENMIEYHMRKTNRILRDKKIEMVLVSDRGIFLLFIDPSLLRSK